MTFRILQKRSVNRGIQILQIVGFLVSLYFLVIIFRKATEDSSFNFELLVQDFSLLTISISVAIYSTGVIVFSWAWIILIKVALSENQRTSKLNYGELIYSYTQANLFKYIPGNFFHLVARQVNLHRHAFSQKKIAAASILEAFCQVSVATSLAASIFWFFGDNRIAYLQNLKQTLETQFQFEPTLLLAIATLFLISIILFIKKFGWQFIFGLFLSIGLSFYVFFSHLLIFLLLISTSLNVTIIESFLLSGVYLCSWVAGFLTIGSSGGLGIREFVYIEFSKFISPKAIEIIFLMRLISMAGDLLAFAIMRFFVSAPAGNREGSSEP